MYIQSQFLQGLLGPRVLPSFVLPETKGNKPLSKLYSETHKTVEWEDAFRQSLACSFHANCFTSCLKTQLLIFNF